ncbi:DJ-1/PfpI family protein [Clavibacter sp. VKM Ac-2542]|uniref:DJ-1/PfpI family protein n=1 Tax=Clavibacter sp. VKM Ac-2542 TaxID=2783811 RepID=UPI00188CB209|nr:DJ-1/PfpI family protein [Clavibacter sp. VKM Ac-2542]MBF4621445.1 DJ-1/PfpI family protein [Clavibacter sp. VKM Ac-2542]
MHDEHDTVLDAAASHAGSAPLDAARSTLLTAPDGDPAKRAAIDRSIAAHRTLESLPGLRFATDATILIVLHPGFELLDAVGPFHFLAATGAAVHFTTTGSPGEPVPSGSGVTLIPTATLSDAAEGPEVILVPGGDTGILLRDTRAMGHLRRLGETATYVTSVCSGSIALAAAGLLDGRRATSHWSVRHLLPGYGAIEVDERVVEDGNRLTAAGVTAGMDLAIRLVSYLCGEQLARFAELGAEYAPEPPFGTGTPDTAGVVLTAVSRDFLAPLVEELRAPSH